MDRQDEIFQSIQSLSSMLEDYIEEQDEIKQEVKELKTVVEHHNKMLLGLVDKKLPLEEENYIISKLNELEKLVKVDKMSNTVILVLGTLIGIYYYFK